MFERIKSIICHPRYIGKYHNDKVWKILLYVLLFFMLYLAVFGVRTFTENPLGEEADRIIISDVISSQSQSITYDSENHTLKGNEFSIVNDSYAFYVLPTREVKQALGLVNIILDETKGYVYYGTYLVSEIEYTQIFVDSFSFDGVSSNNTKDIFYFRSFINEVLNSSFGFFRSMNFVEGIVQSITMYLMLFFLSFIFAKIINPTIEKKVRAKLVLYDTIIYFVVAMISSLFNVGAFIYVAYSLPVIYTSITFRHIVRVVIPKRGV